MSARGKVVIRQARPADLTRLVVIEKRCFRAHRFRRADFEYHLRNRSSILLVAEGSQEMVGYVAGIIYHGSKNRIAKLYSMGVLSNWRRKRVGSLMLQAFEKEAEKRKSRSITLEVRTSNRSARAFYFEFGYEIEGVLKHYYSPGSDALRMRKDLRQ